MIDPQRSKGITLARKSQSQQSMSLLGLAISVIYALAEVVAPLELGASASCFSTAVATGAVRLACVSARARGFGEIGSMFSTYQM
jgi:hypothetical protein